MNTRCSSEKETYSNYTKQTMVHKSLNVPSTVLFIKNWTTNGGQTGGQSTDVHRTVADVRRTDDRPIIITSFLRIDIGSPESVSRARMAYFRNVK